jgi:probable HAF family extracellular repeat protein
MRRVLVGTLCLTLLSVGFAAPAVLADVPPSYAITDLGQGTCYSIGYGLNEAPLVVGHLETSTFGVLAARWDNETPTFLDDLNDAGNTLARAVNEGGLIVGEAYDGLGGVHAVSWTGTTITDLGTYFGNYSTAFAVNDLGQVAGEGQADVTGHNHALLWEAGSVTDLGVLPGGDSSHGRGINNSGQVAGDSEIEPGGAYHAVVWDGGSTTDLGALAGDLYSNAVAINDAGHVTGRSISAAGVQSGFFWNGSMTAIPMLPGGTFLEAHAINNSDQVVGRADQYGGYYDTAFLWEASTGTVTDLQTLLPSGSGWSSLQPFAISDAGQITGYGIHEGCVRAFLMTPDTAPAPTDTLAASVVAGHPVTTDTGDIGATATDPSATTVVSPVDGVVVIREGVGYSGIPGYTLLGQPITITAPNSTPDMPFMLTFIFDASLIPAGEDETTIDVFRDTEIALACNSSTVADPDPCVLDRTRLTGGDAEGDIRITILTSHASNWAAYISDGPHFDFGGFFQPIDNEPTKNLMKAGAAVPIRFTLGDDFGLDVLAAGSPTSHSVDCATGEDLDAVEQTVSASGSSLTYSAGTGVYTYVWKTNKAWTGCRQFVLSLSDGTKHTALFQFKR